MANKLKNLTITSTDLVDQGANPDAFIRLFKRKGENESKDKGGEEKESFLKKLTAAIAEAYKQCSPNTTIEKDAQTFSENLNEELMRDLTREVWGYCDALSESLRSIMVDPEQSNSVKQEMMNTSINQFVAAIKPAIPKWANGESSTGVNAVTKTSTDPQSESDSTPDDVNKSIPKKEETEMTIDKSKMTPDEIKTLEDFEKRYGVADQKPAEPPKDGAAPADDVNKSAPAPTPAPAPTEMHPEVKKALDELEAVKKAKLAEIEDIKKNLEIQQLTAVAKKYELLGKKPDELAAKFYELKKAGGTVYADYVALLDENLATVEKGGLFATLGSDNSGSADTVGKITAAAGEIAKAANAGMTPEAIVKAWENNPELAQAYEAEYRNGGNN